MKAEQQVALYSRRRAHFRRASTLDREQADAQAPPTSEGANPNSMLRTPAILHEEEGEGEREGSGEGSEKKELSLSKRFAHAHTQTQHVECV